MPERSGNGKASDVKLPGIHVPSNICEDPHSLQSLYLSVSHLCLRVDMTWARETARSNKKVLPDSSRESHVQKYRSGGEIHLDLNDEFCHLVAW